jgi:hypothetical protein
MQAALATTAGFSLQVPTCASASWGPSDKAANSNMMHRRQLMDFIVLVVF